jgi:hypothetical protein
MARENVSHNSRGQPVGISCGKKDAIPHIRIGLTEVERDSAAGNSTGGREKRMGVMVGVVERMMLKENLAGKCVWTQDAVLGIVCDYVVTIHCRTGKGNRITHLVITIQMRQAN